MIQFNKCCFCVPLRTGCLILGYLHVVASIILAVVSILNLVAVAAVTAMEDFQIDEGTVAAVVAVYVIVLILVVALLMYSILLVVGIHKERRGYVKAYMIYCLIFIVLYAITFIAGCATMLPNIVYIVGNLILLLLSVYFLLVIQSYWVAMGKNLNSDKIKEFPLDF